MSITPTDHQWKAIKQAVGWFEEARPRAVQSFDSPVPVHSGFSDFPQAYVFGGFAGSGKSTCVGRMIEETGLKEEEVMYMAPTGKAAKILTKKLRADGWNSPATTIHKAIYVPRGAKTDQIKRDLDAAESEIEHRKHSGNPSHLFEMTNHDLQVYVTELENALREAMDNEGPSFFVKSPKELPPEVKLFVVDEASMVGRQVAEDLKSFGVPILAIGDPGQLPPVGDEWGFNMESPDVFLTEIHRQAAENPIIHLATLARQGELLKPGNYGDGVKVVRRNHDDVTLDMERDAMVLVGTHKKRWMLTKKIRDALGYTETGPMSGEPILVGKNSRKYPGLVNGTLLINKTDHGDLVSGKVRMHLTLVDPDADNLKYELWCAQAFFEEHYFRKRNSYSGQPKAVFDAKSQCEQLDWGHVLTVHKAQGSEWDDVVVHDESGVFRDQGSRWLYTGITRASEKLTVVL